MAARRKILWAHVIEASQGPGEWWHQIGEKVVYLASIKLAPILFGLAVRNPNGCHSSIYWSWFSPHNPLMKSIRSRSVNARDINYRVGTCSKENGWLSRWKIFRRIFSNNTIAFSASFRLTLYRLRYIFEHNYWHHLHPSCYWVSELYSKFYGSLNVSDILLKYIAIHTIRVQLLNLIHHISWRSNAVRPKNEN